MADESDNADQDGADVIRQLMRKSHELQRVYYSGDQLVSYLQKMATWLDELVEAGRITREAAARHLEREKKRQENPPAQIEVEFVDFIDRLKNRQGCRPAAIDFLGRRRPFPP